MVWLKDRLAGAKWLSGLGKAPVLQFLTENHLLVGVPFGGIYTPFFLHLSANWQLRVVVWGMCEHDLHREAAAHLYRSTASHREQRSWNGDTHFKVSSSFFPLFWIITWDCHTETHCTKSKHSDQRKSWHFSMGKVSCSQACSVWDPPKGHIRGNKLIVTMWSVAVRICWNWQSPP